MELRRSDSVERYDAVRTGPRHLRGKSIVLPASGKL